MIVELKEDEEVVARAYKGGPSMFFWDDGGRAEDAHGPFPSLSIAVANMLAVML